MSDQLPVPSPHPQTAALHGRLQSGENVVATLEVDLDAQGRFGQGLIALTNAHLLAFEPASGAWSDFALAPGLSLKLSDHGGLAFLELFDTERRLARWRFTLAGNPAAVRLVDAFEREVQRLAGHVAPVEEDAGEDSTFDFGEASKPPSTWVLLRLWRFARPYQGQLLLGFALMLGSIGATLVAPYLSMPLMDQVLIPFQNGQSIDTTLVRSLLGGLLGAALFSWLLGWAKTYLLALVSERIAADLRTPPSTTCSACRSSTSATSAPAT